MNETLTGISLLNLSTITNGTSNSTILFPHFKITVAYTSRRLPEFYKYIYVTLCCMVAFLSAFGNIIVSTTIARYRKLHSSKNLLLLSLATADLLTGVVLIPLYIERFLHQGANRSEPTLCLLRKYIYVVTSSGSLISLAAVSFDRMLSICHPFFHERNMNKRVATKIVFIMWLWIVGYNAFVFYKHKDWGPILASCVMGIPMIVYLVVSIPSFYFPGLVIIFVYLRIYLTARRENRKIQKLTINNSSTPQNDREQISSSDTSNIHKHAACLNVSCSVPELDCKLSVSLMDIKHLNTAHSIPPSPIISLEQNVTQLSTTPAGGSPLIRLRSKSHNLLNNALQGSKNQINKVSRCISRDFRALKTIGMLIGVFLLCWLPTAIFFMYKNDTSGTEPSRKEQESTFYLAESFVLISFVNSAVDPYLYTWREKELRKATKKTLKRFLQILKLQKTNSL